MHVLEAGFETNDRPGIVLLHGFPELAYSWRKVMLPIADAGFHVIAPDRRGYGRTSGSDVRFDDNLDPFAPLNQVRDVLGLVSAFGYGAVEAVIGHDFGSPIAAWCSLIRPDIFRSVVMMSAPFPGPPSLPVKTADTAQSSMRPSSASDPIYDELGEVDPPRKHYQKYFAGREANDNMGHSPQGVHAFLRAYYHMKSADWKENAPFPLKERSASEWAKLPRYYVMDLNKGMAETVAPAMPSATAIAACKWLPENELRVYSSEYQRTGFQGVGWKNIAYGGSRSIRPSCNLFRGGPLMCLHCLFPERATGASTRTPGTLRGCRSRSVRECWAHTLSKAPAIGYSKNDPKK